MAKSKNASKAPSHTMSDLLKKLQSDKQASAPLEVEAPKEQVSVEEARRRIEEELSTMRAEKMPRKREDEYAYEDLSLETNEESALSASDQSSEEQPAALAPEKPFEKESSVQKGDQPSTELSAASSTEIVKHKPSSELEKSRHTDSKPARKTVPKEVTQREKKSKPISSAGTKPRTSEKLKTQKGKEKAEPMPEPIFTPEMIIEEELSEELPAELSEKLAAMPTADLFREESDTEEHASSAMPLSADPADGLNRPISKVEEPVSIARGLRDPAEYLPFRTEEETFMEKNWTSSEDRKYTDADYAVGEAFGLEGHTGNRRRSEKKERAERKQSFLSIQEGRMHDPTDDYGLLIYYSKKYIQKIAVLLSILFFWELLPIFPGHPIAIFGAVLPHGMQSIPYLLFSTLLFLPIPLMLRSGLKRGFGELLTFRTTTGSFVALYTLIVLCSDLLSIALCIFYPEEEICLFHFPVALFIFFAAIGEHYELLRRAKSEDIFCAETGKYYLVSDMLTDRLGNAVADRPLSEKYRGPLMRIAYSEDGLFGRHSEGEEKKTERLRVGFRFLIPTIIFTLLLIPLAFSFGASEFSFPECYRALSISFFAVLFLSPLAVWAVRQIPLYALDRKLAASRVALRGDAAAEKYAKVSRIAVKSELYLSRKHFSAEGIRYRRAREIDLFTGTSFDSEKNGFSSGERFLAYYASAVCNALGGAFYGAFAEEEEKAPHVHLESVSESCVSARVDGLLVELRLSVADGTGFSLAYGKTLLGKGRYRVPVSVAIDGDLIGKFYLLVECSSSYERLIRELKSAEKGYSLAVIHYTFYPFFNANTFQVEGEVGPTIVNLASGSEDVLITAEKIEPPSENGEITALGRPEDLVLGITAAKKIVKYRRFLALLSVFSVLAGAGCSVLLAVGLLPLLPYTMLAPTVSLLFAGIAYLFSGYYLK